MREQIVTELLPEELHTLIGWHRRIAREMRVLNNEASALEHENRSIYLKDLWREDSKGGGEMKQKPTSNADCTESY